MRSRTGVLTIDYHRGRLKRVDLKYRLRRRTHEVLKAIQSYKGKTISAILDVGTADGLMLDSLKESLDISISLGLDFSRELLKSNTEGTSQFIQSDALNLPFKNGIFDVVVATAVIEHVPDVNKTIKEFNRILTKNGLCIITVPDPFWDYIATKIGYEKADEHVQSLSIFGIKKSFVSNGFKILKAEKFMLSPIGFLPYEQKIEEVIRKIGLDDLMCNQLIVCQKADSPLSAFFD